MTMVKGATVFALSMVMLFASACEDTGGTAEEREAIETAVREYLGALAEAYSTLDPNVLDGHASPNEKAAVHKLLKELLQKSGDRIDAELVGYDVQSMSVFRGINATVRLIEVWNITLYGATDGIEKGRTPNSIQNTLLQMRLVEGRWIVIGRSIMQRETPIPEAETPAGEAA
jgi:Arc/MetJ family transcription regulator